MVLGGQWWRQQWPGLAVLARLSGISATTTFPVQVPLERRGGSSASWEQQLADDSSPTVIWSVVFFDMAFVHHFLRLLPIGGVRVAC